MTLRFLKALLLAMLIAAVAPDARAALATAITYQGSLHDAGTPADGSYDLQFQLFDAPAGGSAVTGIVNIADAPVSDGVFTVELDFGNPFGNADLWLQIGVRRGNDTGAYTVLAPRQPLTATPVALHAEGVAPGAIGSVEIDSSQVQARIANSCPAGHAMRSVGASGAPACIAIGNGTITSVRGASGLAGGGESGEVTLRVADGGIGSTQINSVQVQRRVTGTCSAGQAVTAVAQDGSVSCGGNAASGGLPPRTIVELPAGNDALGDIALLDDGTALLAIRDDSRGLLMRHCSDSTCASGTEVTLAATVGYLHPRIVLRASGLPMVFHSDTSHRLSVIRCSTINCSGPRTAQILDATNEGYSPAEATIPADGLPVVVYRGNNRVAVAKCIDADCSSASARVVSGDIGYIHFSMAVDSDNRPIVGFHGAGGSSVLRCTTPDCSASTINSVNDGADSPAVFINPIHEHTVLLHHDGTPAGYALTADICGDLACASVPGAGELSAHQCGDQLQARARRSQRLDRRGRARQPVAAIHALHQRRLRHARLGLEPPVFRQRGIFRAERGPGRRRAGGHRERARRRGDRHSLRHGDVHVVLSVRAFIHHCPHGNPCRWLQRVLPCRVQATDAEAGCIRTSLPYGAQAQPRRRCRCPNA